MIDALRFVVQGQPATKGSWKPIRNQRNGMVQLIADNPGEPAWATQIAWMARASLRNRLEPDARRYIVELDFTLLPPPNRTRTNKRDLDKLGRSVLDALTGIVWLDDEQVDRLVLDKGIVGEPGRDAPGVVVTINVKGL
jgi:Holliday junction resolvase RusA-like endonuclease